MHVRLVLAVHLEIRLAAAAQKTKNQENHINSNPHQAKPYQVRSAEAAPPGEMRRRLQSQLQIRLWLLFP